MRTWRTIARLPIDREAPISIYGQSAVLGIVLKAAHAARIQAHLLFRCRLFTVRKHSKCSLSLLRFFCPACVYRQNAENYFTVIYRNPLFPRAVIKKFVFGLRAADSAAATAASEFVSCCKIRKGRQLKNYNHIVQVGAAVFYVSFAK